MADRRVEQTTVVPPAAVWKKLAAFDRIAEWSAEVDHSSFMTSREEGIGAVRRVQVGPLTLREEIIEWEPEQTLAYELQGLPAIVSRVVNSWEIAADGAGSRVSLTLDVTPGPKPPMRLAARVLARRIGSTNEKLLAGLVAAVERDEKGAG
ncbi:MAG: SRPBCC family protein [Acidimicrobiales bacterium]|nr:SRPBCC family protein [Acidimicrobiales bacterium]